MLKANEVIAGKYWIVNSSDGRKVGTLRAVDAGYEFFDSRTNTTSTFDSMSDFNVLEREEVKEDNALINGYPTGVSEPVAVDHDTLPAFTKTKTAKRIPTRRALIGGGLAFLKNTRSGRSNAFLAVTPWKLLMRIGCAEIRLA